MNDLISRSALIAEIKRIGGQPFSEWDTMGVLALAERIPAVNAETYLEQLELVKEAFEMAKSDLRPVRHGRWEDNHCTECGEMPMGTEMWDCLDVEPPRFEWFMDYCPCCGAKMDADSDLSEIKALADLPNDSDLERMTRFAMQQAINNK